MRASPSAACASSRPTPSRTAAARRRPTRTRRWPACARACRPGSATSTAAAATLAPQRDAPWLDVQVTAARLELAAGDPEAALAILGATPGAGRAHRRGARARGARGDRARERGRARPRRRGARACARARRAHRAPLDVPRGRPAGRGAAAPADPQRHRAPGDRGRAADVVRGPRARRGGPSRRCSSRSASASARSCATCRRRSPTARSPPSCSSPPTRSRRTCAASTASSTSPAGARPSTAPASCACCHPRTAERPARECSA